MKPPCTCPAFWLEGQRPYCARHNPGKPLKDRIHFLALCALVALTTACASVGVRTIGHQPIKIIIGAEPTPTPCATPGGAK